MILIFSSVKTQLQWSQRCSDQLQRKIQSTMEELSVIQEKLGKLSFILLNTNEICRLPCKNCFFQGFTTNGPTLRIWSTDLNVGTAI